MTPAERSATARATTDRRLDVALVVSLVVLFVVVYLLPLDYRPLFSPDETRYAEIPREMLATGDWTVPRLNGLRYFEKPPLGYWANAVFMTAFGIGGLGVRFASALSAALTAMVIFRMARSAGGCRRASLFAVAAYLTFAEVYIVGTFGLLDGPLALWLCAGIYAFYKAVYAQSRWHGHGWALAAGLAFGCAFLTKGFLGLFIPSLVLAPWLAWTGQVRTGLRRSGPCIAAALAVALPWSLAIHLREPDYWRYFFWEEHIRRFMGEDAQHKQGALYFLKLLPLLALPWIYLLPAAVSGLLRSRVAPAQQGLRRLLALWVLLPLLFFSVSSGKLITYVLPCFAPLAVIVAVGLFDYLAAPRTRLFAAGQGLLAVVLGGFLVGLIVTQSTDRWVGFFAASEGFRVLLFGAALALGVLASLAAVRARTRGPRLIASLLAVTPLLGVLQYVMPDALVQGKSPGLLLEPLAASLSADAVLVADSNSARSTSLFFRRADAYTLSDGGELRYGLDYPDAAGRYLDLTAFEALLRENADRREIVIVCKRSCGDGYEALIPTHAAKHEHVKYRAWVVPRR